MKERGQLEERGLHTKWFGKDVKEVEWGNGRLDACGLRGGRVTDSFEHGNEFPVS